MRVSRSQTLFARFVLDQLMPPVLRDSPVLMEPLFRLVFGKSAALFADFRSSAWRASDTRLHELSNATIPGLLRRDSDLGDKCAARVVSAVIGSEVLDVGFGAGFLAAQLRGGHTVTGIDLSLRPCSPRALGVRLVVGAAEWLPFASDSFDTVVCTHVLEHVRDIRSALDELRRVARRRIIVVIPLQRPYRYTFDTHLHFFPYPESFLLVAKPTRPAFHEQIEGDLLYIEEAGDGAPI